MKPTARYNEFIQRSGFVADPVQQHAMGLFDQLQGEIMAVKEPENRLFGVFRALRGKAKPSAPRGLYLWGGVGRGKTLLMDIFFQSLDIERKKRIHFHAFMKMIHDRLAEVGRIEHPLRLIAREMVTNARVLCLDEFVVTDIGDAMLVAQLLEALFDEGVVLVSTSNSEPENLYRDGLQRSRFLPAIALLQAHCAVVNVDGGQDYRVLGLKDAALYRYPHDDSINLQLLDYLDSHHVMAQKNGAIEINDRSIDFEFCAEDSIWFSFENLCLTARSRLDYLEIASQFSTLILTGIQRLDEQGNDVAKRFISLIDVLYDHRVKLICSAEVSASELYTEGYLADEFQRTLSRLIEMQTAEYWQQSHRID